jgi:cytochrome c biogenesis protein CcdA
MTHLPFIVAAYTLGIGAPLIFAISAWNRLRLAKRRLAVIDPRARP